MSLLNGPTFALSPVISWDGTAAAAPWKPSEAPARNGSVVADKILAVIDRVESVSRINKEANATNSSIGCHTSAVLCTSFTRAVKSFKHKCLPYMCSNINR
jgi:hypothetical protein